MSAPIPLRRDFGASQLRGSSLWRDGWRSSCTACGWMAPSFAGPEKKLRPHDRECPMVVRIAGSTDDCSVGAFAVKPLRLRRAAVRLWGLTAQPDRANKSARAVNAHL